LFLVEGHCWGMVPLALGPAPVRPRPRDEIFTANTQVRELPDPGPGVDPFLDLAQPLHEAPHHREGDPRLVRQAVLHLLRADPRAPARLPGLHRPHPLPAGEDAHPAEDLARLHVVIPTADLDLRRAAEDDEERVARIASLDDRVACLVRTKVAELQD